jgi:hypothetical protein
VGRDVRSCYGDSEEPGRSSQYRLIRKWDEPDIFEPTLFPGLTLPLEGSFDWSDFEGLGPA